MRAHCEGYVEQHWEQIRDRLELEWAESPPQYGTLWNVMAGVELRQVEEAVRRWLKDSLGEAISVDAKSLRGSAVSCLRSPKIATDPSRFSGHVTVEPSITPNAPERNFQTATPMSSHSMQCASVAP